MNGEQRQQDRPTPAATVGRFIGGFLGTLALMGLGLAIGTNLNDAGRASVPIVILFTVLVGSVLIVLGAMNRSRPIVAGGVTAFAIVLAVFGACFMMLS